MMEELKQLKEALCSRDGSYHVLLLLLKGIGVSNRAIARSFGCSHQTINRDMKLIDWLLEPENKALWDEIKAAHAGGTFVPPGEDGTREESRASGTFVPQISVEEV